MSSYIKRAIYKEFSKETIDMTFAYRHRPGVHPKRNSLRSIPKAQSATASACPPFQ